MKIIEGEAERKHHFRNRSQKTQEKPNYKSLKVAIMDRDE